MGLRVESCLFPEVLLGADIQPVVSDGGLGCPLSALETLSSNPGSFPASGFLPQCTLVGSRCLLRHLGLFYHMGNLDRVAGS